MAGHTSRWSRILVPADAGTDERYTPDWFLDRVVEILGEIDLDPALTPDDVFQHVTSQQRWMDQGGVDVFLNPLL